jgi:dTDP-4-amino-4,6-dideoxygalactose transaminase
MEHRPYIPYNRPTIGEEEIAEVAATLRSGWITTGPRTAQFEEEFRAYTGAAHALAVNSCTGGLHLALTALGIGPGDEVITTPLTFCATVNTVLQVGATPVLADVGEDGNLDPESVERSLTGRTRALLPVHLGGLPCRMSEIWRMARERGLRVVEDAAHAVGSRYRGAPIGSGSSDAVAFSFYATKNLTTGEGGMVTTPHAEVAELMRVLCLHGISRDAWNRYADRGKWYYQVETCGFKYNLSDVQSAIGIHQLRKLEGFISLRARLAGRYHDALAGVEEVEVPPDTFEGRHSWHLYAIRLRLEKLDIDREAFIRELAARGIGTSVHFIPIPLHAAFAREAGCAPQRCPRAMELYPRLVSLPLYPAMTEEQVDLVAAAVREVTRAARKAKPIPVT